MAETTDDTPTPTPTASTSVKPLTPAERQQLDALKARDEAATRDAEAADRKAKLDAMPNLVSFVDAFKKADLGPKIAAALANREGTDGDTTLRLGRVQQALDYDFQQLVAVVEALRIDPA